jgi:hypothetical protein
VDKNKNETISNRQQTPKERIRVNNKDLIALERSNIKL